MVRVCVYCKEKKTTNTDLSFHKVPMKDARRNTWIHSIRNELVVKDVMYLCSKHFSDNCFTISKKKKTLKCNAVPTIFKPNKENLDFIKPSTSVEPDLGNDCKKGGNTREIAKVDPKSMITKVVPKSMIAKVDAKSTISEVDPKSTITKVDAKSTIIKVDPKSTITKVDPKSSSTKVEPKSTITKVDPKSTISKVYPKSTITKVDPKSTSTKIDPKLTSTKVDPKSKITNVDPRSTINKVYPKPTIKKVYLKPTITKVDTKLTIIGNELIKEPSTLTKKTFIKSDTGTCSRKCEHLTKIRKQMAADRIDSSATLTAAISALTDHSYIKPPEDDGKRETSFAKSYSSSSSTISVASCSSTLTASSEEMRDQVSTTRIRARKKRRLRSAGEHTYATLNRASSSSTLSGLSDNSDVEPTEERFAGNDNPASPTVSTLSALSDDSDIEPTQEDSNREKRRAENCSPSSSTISASSLSSTLTASSEEMRDEVKPPIRAKKKRRLCYIGDVHASDFSTPVEAQKHFKFLKEKNEIRDKKMRYLSARNRHLTTKIRSLNSVISDLTGKQTKSRTDNSVPTLPANLPGPTAELVNKILQGSKKQKYTPELIKFAVTLNLYSKKAYEYVRKSFNNSLPHSSTITKWYKGVEVLPDGETERAINILEQEANEQ